LAEDVLLALETDVLRSFYEAGEVGFGEDVVAWKSLLDANWECVEKID
jgi:hypothetical protein